MDISGPWVIHVHNRIIHVPDTALHGPPIRDLGTRLLLQLSGGTCAHILYPLGSTILLNLLPTTALLILLYWNSLKHAA